MLASRSPLIDARDRIRELLQPATDAQEVVVDAAGLEFMSRSAASELLATIARWRQAKRTISWQNVAPPIAQMLCAVDPDIMLE